MDPLEKFVIAQARDYQRALEEIKNGKKQTHWMWYIFPQIQGLGFSDIAMYYAIKNKQEAEAYLKHPLLGPRLLHISKQLLNLNDDDPIKILGRPNDLKLKSSMTLFAASSNAAPIFQAVLDKFFEGNKDIKTLRIINAI